ELVAGTGDPCAAAARIAARNRAALAGCVVDGETVVVTTAVSVDLGSLGVATATGRARAGPVPEPGAAG
uniref:hypothetical protein n=1 Tax=Cumulibacter manganitolerans TaxID=1884992 RepID=UPI001E533F9F